MIRSLKMAEKAMQMEQVRIDALANNLANVNSSGFRQILTRVSASEESGGPRATAQGATGKSDVWANRSDLEMGHALDVRPGPVKETGRDTDLALMGRGFFVISAEGGERYTRNGSFLLNEQRQLITPQGDTVMGEGGAITLDGSAFSIEPDGTVMVDGNAAARLKVVDFAEPQRLEHLGANLLAAPDGLAPVAVPAEEITLAQGHLEGSNVNAIDTLVAMIAAQRAFEVQSKVMQTEDEILKKSVNNLPRISG